MVQGRVYLTCGVRRAALALASACGVGVRRRRQSAATICGDNLRRRRRSAATICGDNLRRLRHFKFLNSKGVFGSIDIDIDIFTLDIFTPIPESFPPMLTQNCLF